jgi:4-amino-4-deoxy-L-arabinose transferase-like glycosyltransferase
MASREPGPEEASPTNSAVRRHPSRGFGDRPFWAALVAIALLGVVLRTSFIDVRMGEPPPRRGGWRSKVQIEAPLSKVAWYHDEQLYYLSTALNSFKGRGFFPDYNTVRDGIYVPPPGQSFFILGVFTMAGKLVEPSTLLKLQALIASGMILLAALMCRRLVSPLAGLTAALLLAVHPDLIYQSAFLMTESNYLFLLTLFLFLITRAIETGSSRWTTAAALSLGLLHLQRINAAPAGVAIAAAWLLYTRGKQWRNALILGAVPFLVLVPWLARNLAVYGEPIWVNSNAGVHLYLANNPKLDAAEHPYIEEQRGALIPEIETRLHDENGRLTVTYYEYSRIYEKKMWEYVRAQPLHFLRNCAYKFVNQFTIVQTGSRVAWLRFNSEALYTAVQRAILVLGLLGLAAFLWTSFTPQGAVLVLMFLVFSATGTMSILSTDGRYGVHLKLFLILFVALGLGGLISRFRHGRTSHARASET